MGRRPGARLDEDSLERILELGGKGATNYVIASAIGIHPDTFQVWLKRGREELAQTPDDGDRVLTIYEQLYVDLEQRRAELAADMSEKVIEAAMSSQPHTWQAAMTYLERRYPNEWGKRETRIHEGEAGRALPQINVLVLNDQSARSAHRDLLRSVDAANRSSARLALGPGVDSEREAGSDDGPDDLVVDSR